MAAVASADMVEAGDYMRSIGVTGSAQDMEHLLGGSRRRKTK
jgi:hypothetical protein